MAKLIEPFAGAISLDTATRLLDQFGTLGNLVFASPEALSAVNQSDRPTAKMIHAARILVEAGLIDKLSSAAVASENPALLRYVSMRLRSKSREELYVIFSDEANCYIADETIARGGRSTLELRLRPLFQRAFELGARGFVLAHNHPSTSLGPSQQDIVSTKQISRVAHALEIRLIDHLIVAGSDIFSMKKAGLL